MKEKQVHVPDGFLDAPTSLATGALAVGTVALALRKSRAELDERTAPLAGLTAAFVFAAQMINFPVGVGTSGHLMGGALAAVLVGPWTALLVLTVVLTVQALLFADGGITALGTNITLIGTVTVVIGWAVTRLLLRLLPRRPNSIVPASFVGAFASVPAAALVFVVLFSLGGAAEMPVSTLVAAMVGWHTVIGIGEAVITALTVGAVVAVRPDLVYATRDLRPTLQLRTAEGTVRVPVPAGRAAASAAQRGMRRVVGVGTAVALALAGFVSFYAASSPDGLERVADDLGFAEQARDSAAVGSPFADYGFTAVGEGRLGVLIAGVAGVLVTIGLATLLARVVAARRAAAAADRSEDVEERVST